ncbi:MAG TPA: hypothetical protein VNF68_14160 [Candidatus Baltobacteraceae bacterium]|nr:hypothetical protein [Candidatus Baltobacteraceae bacterium]
MKVEFLTPDVMPERSPSSVTDASAFAKILDDLAAVLGRADGAETAYAHGAGNLGDAIYERARADVALSVATAAAQRTAQALTTVLNMQI